MRQRLRPVHPDEVLNALELAITSAHVCYIVLAFDNVNEKSIIADQKLCRRRNRGRTRRDRPRLLRRREEGPEEGTDRAERRPAPTCREAGGSG